MLDSYRLVTRQLIITLWLYVLIGVASICSPRVKRSDPIPAVDVPAPVSPDNFLLPKQDGSTGKDLKAYSKYGRDSLDSLPIGNWMCWNEWWYLWLATSGCQNYLVQRKITTLTIPAWWCCPSICMNLAWNLWVSVDTFQAKYGEHDEVSTPTTST